MYRALLYYKFVEIDDPQSLRDSQFELCQKLGLKGRILVAKEGLNGTVCGSVESTEEYERVVHSDPRFADMVFKVSQADEQVFPKLRVVVREEVVTLAAGEKGDVAHTAPHMTPEEFNSLLHSDEEYYVLDTRNNYESVIGKFHGAIAPDIHNFRELPETLEKLSHLKNKKIVTYCTGGVRCEKATALMKNMGFSDVYQLDGGIVTYGNKFPDDGWEGKCYVFDKRIAVDINTPENEKIVSQCIHCEKPTARMINCSNVLCNKQIVCCAACDTEFQGGCSADCGAKSRYIAQV